MPDAIAAEVKGGVFTGHRSPATGHREASGRHPLLL